MAVQVQGSTTQKRDLFDYILGGLQAAANFTSIQRARAELGQIDELKARQEKLDQEAAKVREQDFAKTFAKVPDQTPDAVNIPGKEGLYLPRSALEKQQELALERQKIAASQNLAQADRADRRSLAAAEFAKDFTLVPEGTKGAVALRAPGSDQSGLYLPRASQEQTRGQMVAKTLAPGEKQRDEEFAKEMSEFSDRGGFADVAGDIKNLEGVSKILGSGKSLTGPIQGFAPDFIRKATNEEAINIREDVRRVVAKNLKLILGGQYTQQEGQALLDRAFDGQVSEEENKRRVDNLVETMRDRSAQKLRAADYFERNGTLKGFESVKGANEAFARAEQKPTPEEGTAYAAPAGKQDPYDRFRKPPNEYKEGDVVRKEDGALVIRRGGFWIPFGE